MNKTLQTIITVVVVLVGAAVLVGAGFFLGRSSWGWATFQPGRIMGFYDESNQFPQYGYGMMDRRGGYGMMDSYNNYGMMGPGMLDSYNGYGMMGSANGYGMMGGYSASINADPLSAEESLRAVEAYLGALNNDDLVVEEIMVFDNNSYGIVKEESTGVGAFELLVDPVTKTVFPEFGPNMMWNLKYGMHTGGEFGSGMMGGGMMSGYSYDSEDLPKVSAEMTVSEAQALENAQNYLDTNLPGVTVSDEITAFYGYYTIDLERDGEIVGMLSVNGSSGQVFPHTWHGEFIEMTEHGHE